CGFVNLVAGTLVGTQIPGDCKAIMCDGTGIAIAFLDNTDIPADDGNSCTFQSCAGGVPVYPPAPAGMVCNQGGGHFCDGSGTCVQCLVNADCPGGATCSAGSCVPTCVDGVKDGAETDVDCGGTCAPCAPGKNCLTNLDCMTNACDAITLTC